MLSSHELRHPAPRLPAPRRAPRDNVRKWTGYWFVLCLAGTVLTVCGWTTGCKPKSRPAGVAPQAAPTTSRHPDAPHPDAPDPDAPVAVATDDIQQPQSTDSVAIEDENSQEEDSHPVPESETDAADKAIAADVQAQAPAAEGERFLLLPGGGPLLVEVQLYIRGQPVGAAFDRFMARALVLADSDGDGTVTWDELTQSPAFRYGQLGNVAISNESERQQMIRLYDVNQNQRVDAEEVPRLLTRNAGGSRPFSFKSSNYYRESNRLDSPVRRRLDQNADGWIDQEEWSAASQVLRNRDGDGNDILRVEDFRLSNEDFVEPLGQRRTTEPDAAILISHRLDPRYVLYTFRELYSWGAELTPQDFPRVPRLFEQLDADADGSLSRDEIAGIGELDPHIRLRIDFSPAEVEASATSPQLQLIELSSELEAELQMSEQASHRLVLRWPDLQLEFFVNDFSEQLDRRQQAEMILAELDADSNEYLDEGEVPQERLFASFDEVDLDSNGKIFLDELVQYLEGQPSAVESQIQCRAGFGADALFSALDTTADRRLTSRELDAVSRQLEGFDRNHDGLVAVREIPDAMLIGFARGNAQQGQALFQVPASSPGAATLGGRDPAEIPPWFRGMDVNQDDDISPREFLGTPEQFQQLDVNQDGYIEIHESSAARVGRSSR